MSDHADVEGLREQRDGLLAERNAMARHVAELRAEVDHLRTVGARADGERMQEVLRLRAEVERLRKEADERDALLSACRELLERVVVGLAVEINRDHARALLEKLRATLGQQQKGAPE